MKLLSYLPLIFSLFSVTATAGDTTVFLVTVIPLPNQILL